MAEQNGRRGIQVANKPVKRRIECRLFDRAGWEVDGRICYHVQNQMDAYILDEIDDMLWDMRDAVRELVDP